MDGSSHCLRITHIETWRQPQRIPSHPWRHLGNGPACSVCPLSLSLLSLHPSLPLSPFLSHPLHCLLEKKQTSVTGITVGNGWHSGGAGGTWRSGERSGEAGPVLAVNQTLVLCMLAESGGDAGLNPLHEHPNLVNGVQTQTLKYVFDKPTGCVVITAWVSFFGQSLEGAGASKHLVKRERYPQSA